MRASGVKSGARSAGRRTGGAKRSGGVKRPGFAAKQSSPGNGLSETRQASGPKAAGGSPSAAPQGGCAGGACGGGSCGGAGESGGGGGGGFADALGSIAGAVSSIAGAFGGGGGEQEAAPQEDQIDPALLALINSIAALDPAQGGMPGGPQLNQQFMQAWGF